jgi:hypothetical protein
MSLALAFPKQGDAIIIYADNFCDFFYIEVQEAGQGKESEIKEVGQEIEKEVGQ